MRKGIIRDDPKKTRKSRPSGLMTVSITVLLASAALLLFAGCPTSDVFSDYRGRNLVLSYDFDSGEWSLTYDVTTGFTYMDFQSVSAAVAGTTSGLPDPSAPIYRLEAVNLAENGDFLADPFGLNWSVGGGYTGSVNWETRAGDEALDGDALYFDSDGSDTIDYDIKAGSEWNSPGTPGVEDSGSYVVRFDFKSPQDQIEMFFEINDGAVSVEPWGPFESSEAWSVRKDFPTDVSAVGSSLFVSSAAARHFSIGTLQTAPSSPPQIGGIDNFRIARVDTNGRVEAVVPLDPAGTDLDLVTGWYRFSVWVKMEDPLQVSPNVANTFQTSGITLTVNADRRGFEAGTDYTSSEWTKLSFDTFVDASGATDPGDAVITLGVFPYDSAHLGTYDIGRVLVSTPGLEFLPDGP